MNQYEIAVPVPTLTFSETGALGGATCIPAGILDIKDIDSCLANGNLSDGITEVCGISTEQALSCSMLVIPRHLDEESLAERRRDFDEHLLRDALGRADAILDLIRLEQCRLDCSETWIGNAGYVMTPGSTSLFVLVLDQNSDVCRFIARKTWDPVAFPLLTSEVVASDIDNTLEPLLTEHLPHPTLGARLKRLLRSFGESCSIASDDLRLLSIIFALEGALCPEGTSSREFKRSVAVAQYGDTKSATKALEKFSRFYRDVRNVLVHRGSRYEELTRDRRDDFMYLQSLVHGILLRLASRRHSAFDEHWKWTAHEVGRIL